MSYKNCISGNCHCGNISIDFYTNKNIDELIPRNCSCSFCMRYSASLIADPEGKVEIRYEDKNFINSYQFSHKTADFIFYKKCGFLVASLCNVDVLKAVVNRMNYFKCKVF